MLLVAFQVCERLQVVLFFSARPPVCDEIKGVKYLVSHLFYFLLVRTALL